MFRTITALAAVALTALLFQSAPAFGQTPIPKASIAAEADVIAYGLPGYSGIVSLTFPNKIQVSLGMGRYEVPEFLLKGDANFETAQWKATSTSIQVARVMYRFRGAIKSGLAVGAVVINQRWRLRSERLGGETTFRPLSVGLTAGYYVHVGKHFYLYPTTAFTYNRVSGSTSVRDTDYHVAKFSPNGSLHAGWEWGR